MPEPSQARVDDTDSKSSCTSDGVYRADVALLAEFKDSRRQYKEALAQHKIILCQHVAIARQHLHYLHPRNAPVPDDPALIQVSLNACRESVKAIRMLYRQTNSAHFRWEMDKTIEEAINKGSTNAVRTRGRR
ncbi:hypothetical protein FPOAC2_10379 [Fusarium poae]|uniref:uncharacterized protein n=1 Tax=Fusarium poae TaxID=36050 RepID=UPI001D04F034|nr:uncharacterized protein FPOAC1_013456 [Fusarium poae]KAG8664676.1 hypothetical protein FPOAC1_013456 [Fusarium poae]